MSIVLAAVLLQVTTLSGDLPARVDVSSVTRVQWLSGDAAQRDSSINCEVHLPHAWLCREASPTDVGVAVVETVNQQIGFVVKGRGGVIASDIAAWGRLIHVVPLDDTVDVTVTALDA